MNTPREITVHRPGDVFQINERERGGWTGAFVMAESIKPWGIQGFVHHINTHEDNSRAYIRLEWAQVEYIGRAVLIPEDVLPLEPAPSPVREASV